MVIWRKKFTCISHKDFKFKEKRKWCVSYKKVYMAWNTLQDNGIISSITSWVAMVFWGVRQITVAISRGMMAPTFFFFFIRKHTKKVHINKKRATNGRPKAYRKYTIGAKRRKQKREGLKKTHPPSTRVQPVKKVD